MYACGIQIDSVNFAKISYKEKNFYNSYTGPYLYIKVWMYLREADLVRQLGSLSEDRITVTASCRKGRLKILHLNSSNVAFARVDKSLFDVS